MRLPSRGVGGAWVTTLLAVSTRVARKHLRDCAAEYAAPRATVRADPNAPKYYHPLTDMPAASLDVSTGVSMISHPGDGAPRALLARRRDSPQQPAGRCRTAVAAAMQRRRARPANFQAFCRRCLF